MNEEKDPILFTFYMKYHNQVDDHYKTHAIILLFYFI